MHFGGERFANWVVATAALVAIPLTIAAILLSAKAVISAGVDCGDFTFDRVAWNDRDPSSDGRGEQAPALVQCGTLKGLDPSTVEAMLGRRHGSRRKVRGGKAEWTFYAGVEQPLLGFGDGRTLYVRFGPDDLVKSARLLSVPD